MKKVMFAAAVAASMVAFGAGEITSQNVVGYTTGGTINQNNFKTVSFNTVGYNTADIQDIKISDGGAGAIGWGEENFSVWEGVPTVVEGSGYTYWHPSMDPQGEATDYYWGNESCEKVTYSIAPGQGVVIECAADLDVTTSGQVPTKAVSFTTVYQNNFTGNPFPAAIDIQNITISDEGAGSIGWGEENFSIWEGIPTVVEGSGFTYWHPSMDPQGVETDYYWGNESCEKVTYSIPAGQGVVIECPADLTVTINPPYSL